MEINSKPIAVGRTAEIYAWGEGRILKLLRPGFSPGLIEQEERITSAILQAGIAAPKIFEVVEVDGRPGIVYERIDGPSMLVEMERHVLRLDKYAALLARLHADVHAHTYRPAPPGTPRQKQILAYQVQEAAVLPEAVRQAVLALLERLPDGDALCHNDFHPMNVLMGTSGAVIIDWESASLGSPCADVARAMLTMAFGRPAEGFPNVWIDKVSGLYLRLYVSAYLKHYRAFAHNPLVDLRAWQTVQAAAKVQYESVANQPLWIAVIQKGLQDKGLW